MELCEIHIDETIAYVLRVAPGLASFYCVTGQREGPKRQRQQILFYMKFKGNAKKALQECRKRAEGYNVERPNFVKKSAGSRNSWFCYKTWRVSKKYLRRVGA